MTKDNGKGKRKTSNKPIKLSENETEPNHQAINAQVDAENRDDVAQIQPCD